MMSDSWQCYWPRARPIDAAPRDGTTIYAYDGEWWRPVKWDAKLERWMFQGHWPVKPYMWHPIDHEYERLLAEIARGMQPKRY